MKKFLLILVVLSTLIMLFSCGSEQYTVTFDAAGGTQVATQIIEEGSVVIKPDAPTKEGYTFKGWYHNNIEWSFLGDTVNENIILVAKWEKNKYTVTYDANGGTGSTTKTVEYGSKISAPMSTRANYSLIGWFNGDTQWNFKEDTVTSNITLTAKWEGFTKTVTFNANGGTVDEASRKVKYGEEIGALPTPIYENHTFLGWFDSDDIDFQNRITKEYIVTSNTKLVAGWKANVSFTVTFDAKKGTVDEESRTVFEGQPYGSLPTPTRNGYVFLGWFSADDTNFDKRIEATDIVNSDMSLVAWYQKDENAVTLEFDANGGELDESDCIKYLQKGDRAGTLPTPTKNGCTFLGWFLSDGTELTRTTTINTNTICVALWIEKVYCTDGTENHSWSLWVEAIPATCETPQVSARECAICGCIELKDGAPALGHSWSPWSEEYMSRSRACYECQRIEKQQFKNVTNVVLDPRAYPTVTGNAWNPENGSTLINGMFELDNQGLICGKGTSPLTVTLELSSPTVIDMIYIKGKGTATVEVTVTCEDGSVVFLGTGAFGDNPSCFNVSGKSIVKVEVYMPNPSVGNDIWQEIVLAQKIDK